jgi:hypothetical protein
MSTGPFLVTAYRWGWLNEHQYVVALTNDHEKAEAMAKAECDDRGGKYGCAVWRPRVEAKTCDDLEVCFYAPSLYGEDKPHFNRRMDAFERIGNMIASEWRGKIADLPEWAQKIVQEEMSMAEMFEKFAKQGLS